MSITEPKIYISGQITGLLFDQAYAKFEQAEKDAIIRVSKLPKMYDSLSHFEGNAITVNPMKLEHKPNSTWEDYMEKDIAELLKCDMIYMINNWKKSRGARVERAIAIELGLFIMYEPTGD